MWGVRCACGKKALNFVTIIVWCCVARKAEEGRGREGGWSLISSVVICVRI